MTPSPGWTIIGNANVGRKTVATAMPIQSVFYFNLGHAPLPEGFVWRLEPRRHTVHTSRGPMVIIRAACNVVIGAACPVFVMSAVVRSLERAFKQTIRNSRDCHSSVGHRSAEEG